MVYCISKELEVSGCHHLNLSYESKCTRMHGHNWKITVFLATDKLNQDGMVIDYNDIKKTIHDYLDHGNMNELLPFNPTAENIAAWVVGQFDKCYKCIVVESEKNVAQVYDEKFPIPSKYLL